MLFVAACIGVMCVAGLNAQEGAAGIVGHVVDESGAVLPGVTVTATSPALQVPSVVAVTDDNGAYRLTRLPIGVYTVRYELSGFQAVQRDSVRLTVGFVATLDVKLGIGALQETVTVSGASPVIDVTSVTPRTNFMRETLEELPTTRNSILSLTVQAPGIRTGASTFDVGGSQFTSAPSFNNFGRPGDNWEMIEGVVTTPVSGSGQGVYWDFASVDEAALQTVGNGAEMPASGVYVNALLKSGGDQFHGNAYYAATGPWAQANNIDDRLAGFGITSGGDLQQRYDVNGDLGGHIIQKKLWFYGGGRRAWDDTTVLGALKPDGSPASTLKGQGFWTAKVSYQLSPNHRLIAFDQWNWKYNVRLTAFNSYESRGEQNQKGHTRKAEWQGVFGSALTASLMGGFFNYDSPINGFANGQVATFDQVTLRYTGDQISVWQAPYRPEEHRYHVKGALTWFNASNVAGAHDVKAGFDYAPAGRTANYFPRQSGDYYLIFRSGAPFQVATFNTPVHAVTRADYAGAFLQDSWRVGRLTLNLGLRVDHSNGYIPAQSRDAGTFAPAQSFPEVTFATWNSIGPRIHGAWNLTSRGRTVVKGGWGRFNKIRFSGDVEPANAAAAVTTTYRWNDANTNRQWDAGEVNLDPNGPDFVSRSGLSSGGQGALASLIPNPDEKAPQTDEFSASLEHELISNLAIRVTGVFTRDTNLRRVAGLGRPYESYNIPVSFRDPGPDGRVGSADDGGLLTYYEYPLALQGADYTFTTPVTAEGLKNDYRAFEVAASKRSSKNWQLLASLGRIWKNLDQRTDRIALNPNALLFSQDDTSSWYVKIGGSYRFAKPDVLVSSNLNGVNGEPYARTVSATGGRTIPSISLPVEPFGSRHYPNAWLLDMRVEKRLRFAGTNRLSVRADIFNIANTNVATALTTQSGARFEVPTAIMPARIVVFSGSYAF